VPGQEYDIIDSNYDTIDVNRSQSSNNVVCMEGEYVSGFVPIKISRCNL
jgi:hypothetical protein